MSIPLAIVLALSPMLPLLPAPADPADSSKLWSQWRGPQRNGQFVGEPWPERLDPKHIERQWRVELAPSYSGPVVSRELVFTTETKDRQVEIVRAFDRSTGKERWQASWDGAMKVPFFAQKNGSWIRSTPAYDGENLFVAGMRDVLVCLDARTGTVRWKVDFLERHETPLPAFGFVCSPLVTDEHVYVQAAAALVKLDKRTGKALWRSLQDGGGMYGSAFSSPLFAKIGGRLQLLVQTRTQICGVAPDDGEALWKVPTKAFRGMNILTPLAIGERVFTASYGGRAQLLDPGAADENETPAQVWENRTQGYMTSPVLIDGHIYMFSRANRFVCIRVEDGEQMWTSPPTGDSYWSLIAQGDRILALSDQGELRLIRANPENLEVIDRIELCQEATWAHLALDGGQIFIRELNALSAFTWDQ